MNDSETKKVIEALARCSLGLAHSCRELEEKVAKRKVAEDALAASGCQSKKLLKESADLHAHLQSFSHALLKATEDERKVLGLRLQDEFVQTLVAINLRLLAVQSDLAIRSKDFKKELGIAQELMQKSTHVTGSFSSKCQKSHVD